MSELLNNGSRLENYVAKMQKEQDGLIFGSDFSQYVAMGKKGLKLTREGRAMAARVALRALPSDYSGSLDEMKKESDDKLAQLRQYRQGEKVEESERVFWEKAERLVKQRLGKARRLLTMDRISDRSSELGQAMDYSVKKLGGEAGVVKQFLNYGLEVDDVCAQLGITGEKLSKVRAYCDSRVAKTITEYTGSMTDGSLEIKKQIRKNLVNQALLWHDYLSDDKDAVQNLVCEAVNGLSNSPTLPISRVVEVENFDTSPKSKLKVLGQKMKEVFGGMKFLKEREFWLAFLGISSALIGVGLIEIDKIEQWMEPLKPSATNPDFDQPYTDLIQKMPDRPLDFALPVLALTPESSPTVAPTSTATPVAPISIIDTILEIKQLIVPHLKASKPTFEISNDRANLDLSKSLTIKWSDADAKRMGMSANMPFVTRPITALSVPKNIELAEMFDGTWREDPDLTGIVKTTYPGRFVVWCHSGTPNVKPVEMNPTWLDRWLKFHPGSDVEKKQQVELGCELPRRLGENAPGKILTIEQNGQETRWIVTDARKLSEPALLATMGTTEGSIVMDFALDLAGVPAEVANSDGLTFITCDDYNSDTKEFDSRVLVSVVQLPPAIELGVFETDSEAQKLVAVAETVNSFQEENSGLRMGDFVKESQWFKSLPKTEAQNMTPILDTLVNYGTNMFPNPGESGMQCIGWSGLRVGVISDPLYFGGDEGALGPADVVPEAVKTASFKDDLQVIVDGAREYWTGFVDYRKLRPGDQIMMWGNPGEAGHVVVVEMVKEVNGVFSVLVSEANHNFYPGQVKLSTIDSQEEFDDGFGDSRAILVKNEIEGKER